MPDLENEQGLDPALDAIQQTEPETDAVDAEEPESSTEQTDTGEPKKIGGVAKRIGELTANWREEQRRAQKLESLLEQALQTKQPEAKPIQAQQAIVEPKLEQFQTYEDYVSALADYKADVKIAAWEQRQRDAELTKQRTAQQASFQSRVEGFRSTVEDFDEVAFNPHLPVTDAMAEVINESDNGPELLYQLGKNPEEARRIASLPPLRAAVELGKLAVRMSLPQPKTKTGAPPPIEPLSGGVGTRNPDPDKMSAGEWRIWREQQLRR